MVKTAKGSPNGYEVFDYIKDKEYNLPENLYKDFVKNMGVAVPVEKEEPKTEVRQTKEPEKKAVPETPQNKSISYSPSNKKSRSRVRK